MLKTKSNFLLVDNNKKDLFIRNLLLIFPLMTFIFFNYLKIYHFEGYIINFFAFFHIFMILSYIYYINLNKLDDKTVVNASIYSIIILFLIYIFMVINPYRKEMTFVKTNILFTFLLFLFFNIINIFTEKLIK